MVCPLNCATNATCTPVTVDSVIRYTCRCNDNFKGDGFKSCVMDNEFKETYLLVIIIFCLLSVALVFVIVFFLCKRRLSINNMPRQLVRTMEVTSFESKWASSLEQVSLIDSACSQYPTDFLINIYPESTIYYKEMSCNLSDNFFYFWFFVTKQCFLTLTLTLERGI